MFCPMCGRDNSVGRKFCAACGTNLEAVSQALTGTDDDFFTKIDTALDGFLARYAEHVFKNAPANASEQRVGKSWQVLGQSVVASLVDLLLFLLMWNIIPLRFLLLLISSPVRLLTQQNKKGALVQSKRQSELSDARPQQWLHESVTSVTEETTSLLVDIEPPNRK